MHPPLALVISVTDDTRELEELLYSLGYQVLQKVVQHRGRPDPAGFLGPGKIEEVQDWLAARGVKLPKGARAAGEALQRAERSAVAGAGFSPGAGAATGSAGAGDGGAPSGPPTLVAVNANLKASQVALLERKFGVDVFDRTRVILEIFQQRAHTKEARLQVELARLRYERPLVREYIHLAKRGEHPGFMAGGAYAVDQYYTTINSRISRIQEELERIGKEREVRRKHRRRGGFHLVSLAGYANAGKSSLLKRLSGEDVLVENRMFSTLETRTGRARAGGRDVLVTDTVGFVEGLPPELVKAFRSTLEEIAHADVIVLVLDASDAPDEAARKLKTSLRVLRDFEDLAPIVLALNKSDVVPAQRRAALEEVAAQAGFQDSATRAWVSALEGRGIEDLVARVLLHIPPLQRVRASMPLTAQAEHLLAEVFEEGEGVEVRRGARLDVDFLAPGPAAGSLVKRIRAAGGSAEPEPDPAAPAP